jgi:predicted XRE-type DNA-binding protein
MTPEDRVKKIKHHLIDKGLSFREWCKLVGVSRSVARDLMYGRLSGSRSVNLQQIMQVMISEFGTDIFED